jgi:hypothetical protein
MLLQGLAAGTLVAGCALYAVWALLPAAGRRSMARVMLRLPLPDALAAVLRTQAQRSSGCGCDGCPAGAAPKNEAAPIKVIRRR